METEAEDEIPSKPNFHRNNLKFKFKILLLVLFSNFATMFIFSTHYHHPPFTSVSNLVSHQLLQELNSTKSQLHATRSLIDDLHHKIESTNLLLQALLIELTTRETKPTRLRVDKEADVFGIPQALSDELKLPSGSDHENEIYPPIGAACLIGFQDELSRYMAYDVGGECPVDDVFAQELMLKGCEPLPRRRCRPKSPVGYVEPTPFPDSLWAIPPDSSIIWDPYTCKTYQCLIDSETFPDLQQDGEKTRWLFDRGVNYGIDRILQTKPAGSIRIGLDIEGETGTFAARMRERNITIITSSMNRDGPFNNFIASRGLIPMHVSISQRLPLFENTLDIVHWMNCWSNRVPDEMLELSLYDIYRVLRPGGLFWIDHFLCQGSQNYGSMLDRIGFKKLRWDIEKKIQLGVEQNEWYFSALLEKPMT